MSQHPDDEYDKYHDLCEHQQADGSPRERVLCPICRKDQETIILYVEPGWGMCFRAICRSALAEAKRRGWEWRGEGPVPFCYMPDTLFGPCIHLGSHDPPRVVWSDTPEGPTFNGIPLGESMVYDEDAPPRGPRYHFVRGVQEPDGTWRPATLEDFEPGGLLEEEAP